MRTVPVLAICLFLSSGLYPGEDAHGVMDLRGSECEHGPLKQPDGHFSAFVFCDSALGTNLGIILSKLTNATDSTGVWGVDRRFWQNGPWVTDVTSLAWDPFSDKLYVATAEVYGDGGVFVLDLLNRKQERIYSLEDVEPRILRETAANLKAESHFGFIENLSMDDRTITVSIRLAFGDGESVIVGKKTIRIGPGT